MPAALGYLCIVSDGGREQREGVLHGDAPLDDVLAEFLQTVLTVRRRQVQETWGRGAERAALSGLCQETQTARTLESL